MGTGPRAVVGAPPAGAPRVGLVASAARPNDPPGTRWQAGIKYEPEGCDSGGIDNPCDSEELGAAAAANAEVNWEPYVVYADYRCSAMGFNGKDWDAIARRRLEAAREFQISRELWTGDEAAAEGFPNRFLADVANVDILTESGAVALTHGLACLDQYLAERNGGQQGMIHATAQVVTHWLGLGLLRREGNRIFTVNDTIVVPGRGYTGGDPDGNDAASGDVWAYATDMVELRLDTVIVNDPIETADRNVNTISVRAEQLALASWEGCRHAGVRLDVTVCGIGGS